VNDPICIPRQYWQVSALSQMANGAQATFESARLKTAVGRISDFTLSLGDWI
jgi:hypothetical protein